MSHASTLNRLKQSFEKVLPKSDKRATVSPMLYIIQLVFSFLGDTKTPSLEGIRRSMVKQLDINIARSTFWERLGRKRLTSLLHQLLVHLMGQLHDGVLGGRAILDTLNVTGILAIDSSSITLWDGSKDNFPGTRMTAGIKWHACFDLLRGAMTWFQVTPTTTHDRKCFPDLPSLAGQLLVMDLGYWDYGLFLQIQKSQAFFISRIKSGAVLYVEAVVGSLSKQYIGSTWGSLPMRSWMGDIIEVKVKKETKEGILYCRAIAFWNPNNQKYYWYLTNLPVAAALIYPLYRFRWQIELIFKAAKQSLNTNRMTSNNPIIIENLLLASMIAQLSTHTILHTAIPLLSKREQLAISHQRIAKVTVLLANELIQFLTNSSTRYLRILKDKIKLLSRELFDPNYRRRPTTLGNIVNIMASPA